MLEELKKYKCFKSKWNNIIFGKPNDNTQKKNQHSYQKYTQKNQQANYNKLLQKKKNYKQYLHVYSIMMKRTASNESSQNFYQE